LLELTGIDLTRTPDGFTFNAAVEARWKETGRVLQQREQESLMEARAVDAGLARLETSTTWAMNQIAESMKSLPALPHRLSRLFDPDHGLPASRSRNANEKKPGTVVPDILALLVDEEFDNPTLGLDLPIPTYIPPTHRKIYRNLSESGRRGERDIRESIKAAMQQSSGTRGPAGRQP
jgi:hypothetical protein